MTLEATVSDVEPSEDSDIVLKIEYDPNSGSAARAFEIAAELIHSLEDLDRVLTQTIDVRLETALIVEDLQKSSLKIFLRNVLKEIPDEPLKDGDIKKLVGHFLHKAKYAAIRWLDDEGAAPRGISDLSEEIRRLARETDIRRLPDYPEPNRARLAQSLDSFQEAKSKFRVGEGLTVTLGRDEYKVNIDSNWLPSEYLDDAGSPKELVNEQDAFLIIGKPDFIGKAKWSFKHGKQSLSLQICDEEWLDRFKKGMFPIKPGDALRVRLRITSYYDEKGNLERADQEVFKVFEVIEGPSDTGDLFQYNASSE